jgi:AraC-like DNA-binding protein
LTEKRIEEAKQLLIRYPDLSISDLSQKTGFSSSSHFNNVFKNETRYTPLKFRQMWQQQSNSMTEH